MDTATTVALIGGAYGLMGAVLAAVVNNYRSKLEKLRIDHERQQWLLELHAKFEDKLHDLRLREYPALLAELELLSHYKIRDASTEQLQNLESSVNSFGYSSAGLCMSSATRKVLFDFRFELSDFIADRSDPEAFMAGLRTDLIELMRRDLNHSTSTWRELPTLLNEIQAATGSDSASPAKT